VTDADVERLSGAMQATNAALIVVMGQVAILRAQGRPGAAAAAVEDMLNMIAGMIPGALAVMEEGGRPEAAAGYEDGTEALLGVARRTLTFREG
jgi:hypothetical protein